MSDSPTPDDAVSILQKLGLKEYEARCFVALSRIPRGTAKDISEISDVPRTRVYDATRVLESKGVIEVQHSNPQQFRAVDINTAVDILEAEYESRLNQLASVLEEIEPVTTTETTATEQEVWTLRGESAIANRVQRLTDDATSEVQLLVRDEHCVSGALHESLDRAVERDVDVQLATVTEHARDALAARSTNAEVAFTEYNWLLDDTNEENSTPIHRVLAVDGETILISSSHVGGSSGTEHATVGEGFNNGLVVMLRRLLSNATSQ